MHVPCPPATPSPCYVALLGFTFPGDVVVTDHKHPSHAPATEADPELVGVYMGELNTRGRELAPLVSMGMYAQVGHCTEGLIGVRSKLNEWLDAAGKAFGQ